MTTRKWLAECHAFVDEKEVEGRPDHRDCMWLLADAVINPITYPHYSWRIKPATITINGTELPKPVKFEDFVSQYPITIVADTGSTSTTLWFNTREDRDAVYAKLVEVLGS